MTLLSYCVSRKSVSETNTVTDVPKTVLSDDEFRKTGALKSHLASGRALICIRTSDIYFTMWVEFDISDLHIIPLSICDFRENHRMDGRTFLTEVVKITYTCAP